jgi:microcystin-dependent protein
MSRILTREISGTQCLSISLSTINTNFDNLDTTLCTTSSTFVGLNQTPVAGIKGDDALGIPGIITAYAGISIIPSNWTFCDGRELDKVSFPELYSVIGDRYGTASISTSFKVPNIQNSVNNIKLVGPGAAGTVAYDTWYNVDDYYSAIASADGSPGLLGTITLTFSTTTSQTSAYTYTASGGGDDTYLEWNQTNVIASAGYPIRKTPQTVYSRPFQQTAGTVFRFTRSGSPNQWYISSTLRKTVQTYTNRTAIGNNTVSQIGVSGTYTTGVAPTARLTITSDTPSYFGTQTTYPSGYYRVQYVTGGYNLGSSSAWTNRVGYGCNLVHSNGAADVYIGVYNSTISQSYDALIIDGQNFNGTGTPWYYDFFHTGGTLNIHLTGGGYTDNSLENGTGYNPSAPVYALYSALPTVALNYIISTKS